MDDINPYADSDDVVDAATEVPEEDEEHWY